MAYHHNLLDNMRNSRGSNAKQVSNPLDSSSTTATPSPKPDEKDSCGALLVVQSGRGLAHPWWKKRRCTWHHRTYRVLNDHKNGRFWNTPLIGKTVMKGKIWGFALLSSPFQAKGSRTANWGILGAKRQAWWDGYPKNHLWCEHPIPHAPRPAKKIPGPFREIWPKTTIPTQQEFGIFGKKSLENTSLPNHTWINDTPQFIHQPQSNWSTMIHYDPLINSRDMRKNALQDAGDRLSTNICFPFWIQSWEVECLRTWHISEAIKSPIMEHIFLVIHLFWFILYIYTDILKDLYVCRIRNMYRRCCPKVHDEQGWQNSSHDKGW